MVKRWLLIIAALAGVLTAAALVAVGLSEALRPAPQLEIPMFPDLMARLNDVGALGISSGQGKVTLVRGADGAWSVTEKDGYPANPDQAKRAVVALAEARQVEPRTARPELYARIGVDSGDSSGSGTLVELKGRDGSPLARLIVGKPETSASGDKQGTMYVRKPDEAKSWLLRSAVTRFETDPLRWTDRDMPRLPRERIRSVEITQPDGVALRLSRDDPAARDFSVTGLPEGARPKASVVDEVVGGAAFLSYDDVGRPTAERTQDPVTAVFRSFDGVVLTIRTARGNGQNWLAIDAAFDAGQAGNRPATAAGLLSAEEAERQAASWHARYAGWVFRTYDAAVAVLTQKPEALVAKDDQKS